VRWQLAQDFLKVRTGVTLKPNAAPSSPENGDFYYDTGLGQFRFYQNGSWLTLSGTTASPVWTKFTIPYTSFSTAALTNSLTLLSLPANTMVHQTIIKHSTAFSGPSISAYNVRVGIGGSTSKYAAAFNVLQSVSDSARSITQANDVESFTGATNILVTATSVGANLNAATTGSVDIWLLMSTLP
jgi:hypothetical protein